MPAAAATPRPDVLRGDVLPARRRPAGGPRALRLRPRGGPDRRRAGATAGGAAAPRGARRVARGARVGAALRALRAPGDRCARRRRPAPRSSRCTCSAATWTRCASTATSPCGCARARELDDYMEGSAAVVGRIMAAAAAARPEPEAVARLGVAFQLTNFIRDVPVDWALDRVYLPGLPEDDLRAGRASDRTRERVASEVARARALFAETAERRGLAAPGDAPRRAGRAGGLRPRARPRRAQRLRRARRQRAAAPVGGGGARPCARDAPRHRAGRAAHEPGRRARRRPRLRRELRGPRGRARAGRRGRRRARRRPLRDRRARDLGVRGADAVAAGHGRRGLDPPRAAGDDLHDAARHASATACRGAGRPSTTRELCRLLWAQCGEARFETAKVDGRAPDGVAHRPRRPAARRSSSTRWAGGACWPQPHYQPPDAPLSRGLEVHPGHDGSGDALDVWVERDARPPRLRLARARRGARRASAWAPTTRCDTSGRRPSPWRDAWTPTPSATRATGSRTACAPPPRTASSASATAPGTACRCRARGSGRRSTSGSRAGASCGRCWRARRTASVRSTDYAAFHERHRRAFRRAERLQRLVPALPPRVLTVVLRAPAPRSRSSTARSAGTWTRRTRDSQRVALDRPGAGRRGSPGTRTRRGC